MGLFALGAKLVGVLVKRGTKIVGNIKARKLARLEKRNKANAARKAQILALGAPDRVDVDDTLDEGKLTKLAFGDLGKGKSTGGGSSSKSVLVEWLRENWKWFVPSVVGAVIALISLIVKLAKRKR